MNFNPADYRSSRETCPTWWRTQDRTFQAMQWTCTNALPLLAFTKGVPVSDLSDEDRAYAIELESQRPEFGGFPVKSPIAPATAWEGDYVIKDCMGDFYVVSGRLFETLMLKVPSESVTS